MSFITRYIINVILKLFKTFPISSQDFKRLRYADDLNKERGIVKSIVE